VECKTQICKVVFEAPDETALTQTRRLFEIANPATVASAGRSEGPPGSGESKYILFEKQWRDIESNKTMYRTFRQLKLQKLRELRQGRTLKPRRAARPATGVNRRGIDSRNVALGNLALVAFLIARFLLSGGDRERGDSPTPQAPERESSPGERVPAERAVTARQDRANQLKNVLSALAARAALSATAADGGVIRFPSP
jgi:hypothetical protein